MQALIIDREVSRLDRTLIALMEAGVQVTGTGSIRVAETCITRMCVDLMIIERGTMGDALGDTLGMAEERNPNLVSILRTDDVARDQDELTPHFPSLHCVVGLDVLNSVALKIGLASLYAQSVLLDSVIERKPLLRQKTPAFNLPQMTRPASQLPSFAEAV